VRIIRIHNNTNNDIAIVTTTTAMSYGVSLRVLSSVAADRILHLETLKRDLGALYHYIIKPF